MSYNDYEMKVVELEEELSLLKSQLDEANEKLKLKTEREVRASINADCLDGCNSLLRKARLRIEEAEKVIKFYGVIASPMSSQIGDNERCNFELEGYYERGGKTAREYLDKYKPEN